jgi:hypothetical protein
VSLEQAAVMDAIGIDEATGRVTLVIRHDGPWEGSPAQLYLLQEKLNAYLSFALDGELAATSPDFVNRPLALLIRTTTTPDPVTLQFLARVRKQISFQDIPLEVRIAPSSPQDCGGECHCH